MIAVGMTFGNDRCLSMSIENIRKSDQGYDISLKNGILLRTPPGDDARQSMTRYLVLQSHPVLKLSLHSHFALPP